MRCVICLALICMLLGGAGCSRNIVLRATDEPGSASSYDCGKMTCAPASESDPADYDRPRTTFRALPSQCGQNGIEKILILNASSSDPKVIVTCAAPSNDLPLGTTGR